MAWFRNHYECARCGHRWTDEWSATCDDDCPHCGARHMSPYKSDEADENRRQTGNDAEGRRP
jgi:predicted  nucleic acid-binding Zn-ribbon protein